MKNYFVGVDIGTSNVVMVVGSRSDDNPLFEIEGVSIQSSKKGVIDGIIVNIDAVGNAIKAAKAELEAELGIKIEQAYAGFSNTGCRSVTMEEWVPVKNKKSGKINRDDIVILEQQLKQIKPENRAEAVHQISPICYHVNGEKRTLDPTDMQGSWLKGKYLFSLCVSDHTRCIKMAFVKAGLELVKIFINPLVTHPLLLSKKEAEEGAVIVDIGGGVTDVTVVKEGRVQYFVTLPIGAEAVDNDLKNILPKNSNITSVKHKYGKAIAANVADNEVIPISGKNIIYRNIATVIEARLMDIAEMALADVRAAGFAESVPAGFVLTGGPVDMEYVEQLFERDTNMKARKATSLYGLTEQAKDCIATYGQQTAVAVMMHASGFAATLVRPQTPVQPKPQSVSQPVEMPTPKREQEVVAPQIAPIEVEPVQEVKQDVEQLVRQQRPHSSKRAGFGAFIKNLMGYDDPEKK